MCMLKNLVFFGAIVSGAVFLMSVPTCLLLIYRIAIAFSLLTLHPVTLMHSLIVLGGLLCRVCRFLGIFCVDSRVVCKWGPFYFLPANRCACYFFFLPLAMDFCVPYDLGVVKAGVLVSEEHSVHPWNNCQPQAPRRCFLSSRDHFHSSPAKSSLICSTLLSVKPDTLGLTSLLYMLRLTAVFSPDFKGPPWPERGSGLLAQAFHSKSYLPPQPFTSPLLRPVFWAMLPAAARERSSDTSTGHSLLHLFNHSFGKPRALEAVTWSAGTRECAPCPWEPGSNTRTPSAPLPPPVPGPQPVAGREGISLLTPSQLQPGR